MLSPYIYTYSHYSPIDPGLNDRSWTVLGTLIGTVKRTGYDVGYGTEYKTCG
jgi:hypothetical protein